MSAHQWLFKIAMWLVATIISMQAAAASDLSVNGNAQTSNAKGQGYLMLPAAAFQPFDYVQHGKLSDGFWSQEGFSNWSPYHAAVFLPNDAVITEVTIFYAAEKSDPDASAAEAFSYFFRTMPTSGTTDDLVNLSATPGSTLQTIPEPLTASLNETVDNSQYAYTLGVMLRLNPDKIGNISTIGQQVKFFGARIGYQYSQKR